MTYEPMLWLRGKQVALGPTYAELLEEYWRWENDPVTVNGYGRQVPEPNAAAIRAYERAGFQSAGRLRQAGYWHGQRCDELLMDVLPADFLGPSAFTDISPPRPQSP